MQHWTSCGLSHSIFFRRIRDPQINAPKLLFKITPNDCLLWNIIYVRVNYTEQRILNEKRKFQIKTNSSTTPYCSRGYKWNSRNQCHHVVECFVVREITSSSKLMSAYSIDRVRNLPTQSNSHWQSISQSAFAEENRDKVIPNVTKFYLLDITMKRDQVNNYMLSFRT